MFKKYKIRKQKKEAEKITVKSKEIKQHKELRQKTDIEKIKSLLLTNNKQNIYKKILSLKRNDFDYNIYFLTITIFPYAISEKSKLLDKCIYRVFNSDKFKCVEDVVVLYLKQFLDDSSLMNYLRNNKSEFLHKYKEFLGIKCGESLATFKYNDDILFTR